MIPPKVSILVPVYNGRRYLGECLDSILIQHYRDFEILIADDGSTDGSQELIQSYAKRDRRVRWWENPQNLGLVENWNCLLQAACGEYIKFVFQDDKLLSASAVREMAQALDDKPTITLVACASPVIDEHSQVLKTRDYFHSGITSGQQIVMRCLEQNANLIGEPSVVMFRRSHATDGFDPKYRQIVDLDFFFRLLEQGDFSYISEPLAAFRQHPEQATVKNHQDGIAHKEHLGLMQAWLIKPWVIRQTAPEMQFNFIRSCRKRKDHTPEVLALKRAMMYKLGWSGYAACWLKRKFKKMFK